VLRGAVTEAYRRELVDENVTGRVRAPQARSGRRSSVPLETVIAFLDAVKEHRLAALFLLLVVNGLREGEAFGLYPSDVDLDRRTITIARKLYERAGGVFEEPPKGKRSETIALAPLVIEPLRRHLAERAARPPAEPYLFLSELGRPLRRSAFYKQTWNPIFAAHPAIRRFTPHQLRHSTGTLLKLLGVPAEVARDVLRHASITTTTDQDVVPELQHDALTRLSSLLGNG
jgi:integrase